MPPDQPTEGNDVSALADVKSFPEIIQTEAGRLLLRGPEGYRHFQGLLAPYLTPRQCRQVSTAVHKTIVALVYGLGILLMLRLLAWPMVERFTSQPSVPFAAFNDFESALLLVGAALFSYRFPGTYGSAYIFPWNVLGFFFAMPPGDDLLDEIISAGIVWGAIVLFGLLGLLFDFAAHRLKREGNGWGTAFLTVTLLLYVALSVWDKRFPPYAHSHPADPTFWPLFTLPTALVCAGVMMWIWRRRAVRLEEGKEESLCRWALQRWQIYTVGIVMALTLGVFPFVGFLAYMGLHNRVMEDSPEEILLYHQQQNMALFWDDKGDFLKRKDFDGGDWFFIEDGFWDTSRQNPVRDLVVRLKQEPENEQLYQQLDSAFKNLDLQMTPDSVEAYGTPAEGYGVYALTGAQESDEDSSPPEPETGPSPEAPSPHPYHLTYTPFHVETVDYRRLRERLDQSYFYQITLSFLGIFGWLILWRRGGDSWPARMIGLWLISLFASLPCNFGPYFVPALSNQCWLLGNKPSAYALSTTLRLSIAVMDATGIVVYLISVLGFPLAWLWTYFCWPSRRPAGWKRRLAFFWHFMLVWLVCLIFIVLPGVAAYIDPDNLAMVTAVRGFSEPIFIFGMIGLGIVWRKRHAGENLPALGPWPVVAFMFLQLITLTSWCFTAPLEYPLPRLVYDVPLFPLLSGTSFVILAIWLTLKFRARSTLLQLTRSEKWSAGLLTLTFLIAATLVLLEPATARLRVPINVAEVAGILAVCGTFLTLLRADFLNLQAVDDLSYLLVIIAVPALMALFESTLERVLSRVPLLSEDGVIVISVLLAVSLYPRLHHILGHLCQRFSSPRLHEIEETIEEAIENLVDLGAHSEKQDQIRELFTRMGVQSYVLYVRRSQGSFGHFISHWPQPPDELQLSESLQKFLRARNAFTDFFSVANSWSSFFHQFELRRIEDSFAPSASPGGSSLTCRYLLPICIGKAVCALLILPAGIGEMNRQPFTGVLNSLGVAALTRQDRASAS